jgi:hypothetical protein
MYEMNTPGPKRGIDRECYREVKNASGLSRRGKREFFVHAYN